MRQVDNMIRDLESVKDKLPDHLKIPLSKDLEDYIDAVRTWSDALQLKLTALILEQNQREDARK